MINRKPAALRVLVPYITVRGAKAAAEFYKRAFGAEEIRREDADDAKQLARDLVL